MYGYSSTTRSGSKSSRRSRFIIVVGDPRSNNSNRLTQVSEEIAGTPSYRIADISELNIEWLMDIETVAVTAGASTPTPIVKEVISFLEKFDKNDPSTHEIKAYSDIG